MRVTAVWASTASLPPGQRPLPLIPLQAAVGEPMVSLCGTGIVNVGVEAALGWLKTVLRTVTGRQRSLFG